MEEGDKNPGMVFENVENFDNNELYMDKNAENSKENLESSNTAALFLLPYLFKPICIRQKSKKYPTGWKAGKSEIADGFILSDFGKTFLIV